jgi:outer membrane protein OmpA-like peptidoglycan-associated protein
VGTPNTIEVTDAFVFSKGSAKLDLVKSKDALRSLTQQLKAKPKLRVEIFGYANDKNKDEENLKLSQQRADALRALLIKMKIAKERIVATGRGADGERRIDLAVIP